MKKRKKADGEAAEAMFSEPPAAAPRITPEDIQQKEFGVARMGGYRHHEVDEFLDDLTRAMGELIEENERLRDAAGSSRPPAAGAPPPAGGAPAGAGLQPFLERERDFLRALGELVQEHMERVREMARAAPAAGDEVADDGEAEREPPAAEPVTSPEPRATSATSSGAASTSPSAAPPTEPVQVVESEPAVAGRDEDGGLRELFWGEDE